MPDTATIPVTGTKVKKERCYGIMMQDVVKTFGEISLKVSKGEVVVINTVDGTSPMPGEPVYIRPRGRLWNGHVLACPNHTFKVEAQEVIRISGKQKHAYLMLCKRWERRPRTIVREWYTSGEAVCVLLDFESIWIGIEPDGYTHS